MDAVDRRILTHLQRDARVSIADISRRIGLAASAVHERVKKLEASGAIAGYETRVASKHVGLGLLAFVFVKGRVGVGRRGVGERIGEIPGVQEVHHIAGEDCFIVKMRAPDTDALGQILQERFHTIDGVEATRTTIVLGTVRETTTLPLGEGTPLIAGAPDA